MGITKHLFLTTLYCPAYGWLERHQPADIPEDHTDRFRLEQGREIGELARSFFPPGDPDQGKGISSEQQRETKKYLDAPVGTCLFEPAFLAKDYAARADILARTESGWDLIEVKASIRDKAVYTSDLAYTSMVMSLSGMEPEKRQLYLLNREYRLETEDIPLFVTLDNSPAVQSRTREFLERTEEISALLEGGKKPEVPFSPGCKNCPYFTSCFDFDRAEHLISLPFFSRKIYESLMSRGISRIRDLPGNLVLTEQQTLMKKSLETGGTAVSGKLAEALEQVKWPCFYLDFETTMTALPLFPETMPYQQILTQFSIHICCAPGEVQTHKEYLGDHRKDSRRELAEKLILDLSGKGSIMVYSGFEQSMIKKLAKLFPDISRSLLDLLPRLVDLEKIIRNGIYHPAFKGRTSIKKTLPALVPEMHYHDLAIGNGAAALAVYARMVRGEIPEEEIPRVRQDLLKYCRQDTLGMVKLHEALIQELKKRN